MSSLISEAELEASKLRASCKGGDEDFVLFPLCDIYFPLLFHGAPEKQYAITQLKRLSEKANPREIYSIFMEKIDALPDVESFTLVFELIGQTLLQFTSNEHHFWKTAFPIVYSYLEQRVIRKDNAPSFVDVDIVGKESKNDNTEAMQMENKNADMFLLKAEFYLSFAEKLHLKNLSRPWVSKSMLLEFFCKLLWYRVAAEPWVARVQPKEVASFTNMLKRHVEEVEERQQELTKLIEPFVVCIREFDLPFLFFLDLLKRNQSEGPKASDSLLEDRTDQEDFADVEVFDDDDDEDKKILQSAKSALPRLDPRGIGIFLYHTVTEKGVARKVPSILQPVYVLYQSLPICTALLSSQNLTATFVGLGYAMELLNRLPRYSITVYSEKKTTAATSEEANEETVDEIENWTKHGFQATSPIFENYFGFCQTLASVCVLSMEQFHRTFALRCLTELLSKFSERTRFKLYLSFIQLCPYGAVKALVIQKLKDEMVSEYQALEHAITEMRKANSDESVVRNQVRAMSAQSQFLNARTYDILHKIAKDHLKPFVENVDVLMHTLNLFRFLILKEGKFPVPLTGLSEPDRQEHLGSTILSPLKQQVEEFQQQQQQQQKKKKQSLKVQANEEDPSKAEHSHSPEAEAEGCVSSPLSFQCVCMLEVIGRMEELLVKGNRSPESAKCTETSALADEQRK